MTEKEVGELRRSLRIEHNAITKILGCYVNAEGEIIARFAPSLSMMSEEETEKYLALFRKTLSGAPEKNLLDIPFSTVQVLEGEQHKLLSALRTSGLEDEAAVDRFFTAVAAAAPLPENYVILLTYNRYDVPFKGSDGMKPEGESDEIFSFLLCSICPVKSTKSALTYDAGRRDFCHHNGDSVISAPELGFLFPAFDDRKTNIYNALLYSHSIKDDHKPFTDAVFGSNIRMTASTQNETFRQVLAESLGEACSLGVAKSVHAQICEKMEEHKANHEPEPLVINQYVMEECLENCGLAQEKLESFTANYTENFGKGADLPPKNIVNPKRLELKTPDVTIKIAPGHSDLVESRLIDGIKYILIRADDGVTFNDLDVTIP